MNGNERKEDRDQFGRLKDTSHRRDYNQNKLRTVNLSAVYV